MSDTNTRRPAAATRAKKTSARPSAEEAVRPYHHGSLPQALLAAAEAVLKREGIGGLSLRAIAREAGVSHTAPQHHFGDTAGVLSELAATGFMRLSASIASHAEAVQGTAERRHAIARGYIAFAKKNPDLMRLMSRGEMFDANRPSLIEARRAAGLALAGVYGEEAAAPPAGKDAFAPMDATRAVALTAAWAYVHGLALLLIDGRLNGLAASAQGIRNADELVAAALDYIQLPPVKAK
ncbi:TetR/AcrR family transcriptional regulator [Caballeronia insecticola]|uniref:Transcriptional regulator TetR family n=1 Tax=Caballeronia insecticola TaxID=758793 RepID=R4X0R8_9BURK|nr:TetR-like C-terminal domain-containing protein [Caballeronia insecticola]BAN27800.1 transcriptional regulator TetR family [Caballeronia insecticola]